MWQVELTNLIVGENVQHPIKTANWKVVNISYKLLLYLSSSHTLHQALDLGVYTFMYFIFIAHFKTIKVL